MDDRGHAGTYQSRRDASQDAQQQEAWWPHGIYTESILTTLIITRKFGRGYPIFDSSHQYGITAWYRLLMYCIYNDNHWSLVNIFLGSKSWIILRVDPSSPELDKDTRLIVEHLKWAQTKGPNSRDALRGQEDILIDITVPIGRDTTSWTAAGNSCECVLPCEPVSTAHIT